MNFGGVTDGKCSSKQIWSRIHPLSCSLKLSRRMLRILLGLDNELRNILRVIPAQNTNGNSRGSRYDIDLRELMQADEEARRLRLELIGFYHSHPDAPAHPSSFDREYAWPWYTYLVLSVQRGKPGDICAWSLSDGRSAFSRDQLTIVEWESPRSVCIAKND